MKGEVLLSETADISSVRRANFLAVSGYIRKHVSAPIPRIAEDVGLSLPTVTRAVNYGLEHSVFIPDGMCTVGRGRRAVSYTLNPDFKHCGLFYFFSDTLHCDIYDFKYNCISSCSCPIYDSGALDTILDSVRKLMDYDRTVSHILFAFPGSVFGGVIRRSYRFPSLNGVDLASEAAAVSRCRVTVINNMHAVVGSSWKYTDSYHTETIVSYTYGIKKYGAGISVNGKVHFGKSGKSGDIGRLVSREDNRQTLAFYTEQLTDVIALLDPDKIILYPNGPECTYDMLCDALCLKYGEEFRSRLILGKDLYDDCAHGLLRVFNHKLKTDYA